MVKEPNKNESGRRESPAYPYYAYNAALNLAASVSKCGGDRSDVAKDLLAHDLEMGESSPSFAQLIASAKVFGMIEGWGSYRLTEQGKRYFLPTNEADKFEAALAFFASPSAFRLLIQQFDGNRLPDTKTLANILRREKVVPTSWAERAGMLFRGAAEQLSLIDAGGYLRYSAARHARKQAGSQHVADSAANDPSSTPSANQGTVHQRVVASSFGAGNDSVSTNATRPGVNLWNYTEAGGTVKVETPDPLPRALWERLQKYVTMLEPSKIGKGGQ